MNNMWVIISIIVWVLYGLSYGYHMGYYNSYYTDYYVNIILDLLCILPVSMICICMEYFSFCVKCFIDVIYLDHNRIL